MTKAEREQAMLNIAKQIDQDPNKKYVGTCGKRRGKRDVYVVINNYISLENPFAQAFIKFLIDEGFYKNIN